MVQPLSKPTASRHRGFCKGCYELLDYIDHGYSLYGAAREMGMAYSKAHTLLAEVGEDFGGDLVACDSPQSGLRLTPLGKDLLLAYREALIEQKSAIDHIFDEVID